MSLLIPIELSPILAMPRVCKRGHVSTMAESKKAQELDPLSATTIDGHALHYTRMYELRAIQVQAEQLESLKQLFRQIDDDERAYAILTSSPPGLR